MPRSFARIVFWIRKDSRIRVVTIAMVFSIVLTFIVYLFGYFKVVDLNPGQMFGAAFASYVGGIALFAILGLVVAVVSLTRPEDELFETRARYFLRNQHGNHINFIIERMNRIFPHYAEDRKEYIRVKAYDQNCQLCLIEKYSVNTIKSYLNDIDTQWKAKIELSEMTIHPNIKNKLVSVRIDGVPIGETGEQFDDSFVREIVTHVKANGSVILDYVTEFWNKIVSEPQENTAERYTRNLQIFLENHLDNKIIEFKFMHGGQDVVFKLNPKQRFDLPSLILRDLRPDAPIFTYYVHFIDK